MADELPPLPDTNDPFALLGVDRGADERTIKKAYARLIKVYRPDRAPEQFERIHRAFVLARDLAPVPVPVPVPVPDPVSEPSRALLAHLHASSDADSERLLARALDEHVPLDEIFADLSPTLRDRLLASAELTWPRLRTQLADPGVVSTILLDRFETLAADGRYAQVAAELRDPAFRADGEEHAAVAIPALRAIAVLAWRWDDAPSLLESWCTIPRELMLERLIDRVEHELALSARWRGALGAGALHGNLLRPAHADDFPDALIQLIADTPLASPRRHGALLEDLDRLLRKPVRVLAVCDRIAAADPQLAHLLVRRFQQETPRGPRELDALARGVFDELGQGIVELERTLHAPVRPWMIAAGAVGGVAAAMTAVIPVAVGAGVALGSAGLGGLRLAAARRRYLARVRPGLAALLCRLGVQGEALRQWLSFNPRLAGDLATFDIAVTHDLGLHLLAALAAVVRETQRRPDTPDESEAADDTDD